MGYLDETLHYSGVENGHSNEKIAEKTSLFFSFRAKSAMNGCLVAVFFSLVLGSSVGKTSGRHFRDCLEEYQGVFVEIPGKLERSKILIDHKNALVFYQTVSGKSSWSFSYR